MSVRFTLALAGALVATPALAQDLGRVTTAAPSYTANTNAPVSLDTAGNLRVTNSPGGTQGVTITPSSAAGVGIAPVVSASAENNHVLKNAAGNLYGVYATNLTATAGFLVVLNATTAPIDGAITPLACVPLPASGVASINFNPGPPSVYGTGITAVLTSANTCFTKTTGVITGFISGSVQ